MGRKCLGGNDFDETLWSTDQIDIYKFVRVIGVFNGLTKG